MLQWDRLCDPQIWSVPKILKDEVNFTDILNIPEFIVLIFGPFTFSNTQLLLCVSLSVWSVVQVYGCLMQMCF